MRELAVSLGKDCSLVGILTENENSNEFEENARKGVLLLNAGLIHHIGPNRIYVKMARLLASMGFVVMRFDFSGIGDSGVRTDKLPAFKSVIEETQQVMDWFTQQKGVKQFIAIGLCHGAEVAFEIATIDHRVKGAVLINPPAPETVNTSGPDLMRQHSYYWHGALLNLRSWKRLLLLQSAYGSMLRSVGIKVQKWFRHNYVQNSAHAEIISQLANCFRSIREQKTQLVIITTDYVGGDHYLREFMKKEYTFLKKSGLLSTKTLDGADHVVTPLASQECLLRLVSEWMAEKF
jgi:hypothetical protein